MAKIIGIDLAGMEKNDTGFCILVDRNAVVKILHRDLEILAEIEKEKPDLICIDGPTTLPMQMMRKCDVELQQYGAIPPMIGGMRYLTMRATKLHEALEKKYRTIEVHTTSTAKILGFWDAEPTRRQKALMKMGITGDVDKRILTKDEVDAIVAAITGYLYLEGKTVEVGDKEGKIVIPRI
jgi:predicted nuclease with RNAse H fold